MSGISPPHDGEKRLEDFWGHSPSEEEPRKIHIPGAGPVGPEKPREIDSTGQGRVKDSRLSKKAVKKGKNVRKRGPANLSKWIPDPPTPPNPMLQHVPLCPMMTPQGQCLKPAVRKRGKARVVKKDDGVDTRSLLRDQEHVCEAGHRFVEYHLAHHYDEKGLKVLFKAYGYTGFMSQALDLAHDAGLEASRFQAWRIIKHVAKVLTHLEENWEVLKLPVTEFEIDEEYQRVKETQLTKSKKANEGCMGVKEKVKQPKTTKRSGKSEKKWKLHPHGWPVVAFNVGLRYVTAAVPVEERATDSLDKVVGLAVKRSKDYKGKIVRTDGLPGYPEVIEKYGMRSFAKTHEQNRGHTAFVERWNARFRQHGVRKGRHIPENMLPYLLDIARIMMNWFEETKALGRRTPLEAATGMKFKDALEALYIAELIAPLPRKAKSRKKGGVLTDFSPGGAPS